mgnify:CR=1 FL=1
MRVKVQGCRNTAVDNLAICKQGVKRMANDDAGKNVMGWQFKRLRYARHDLPVTIPWRRNRWGGGGPGGFVCCCPCSLRREWIFQPGGRSGEDLN